MIASYSPLLPSRMGTTAVPAKRAKIRCLAAAAAVSPRPAENDGFSAQLSGSRRWQIAERANGDRNNVIGGQ